MNVEQIKGAQSIEFTRAPFVYERACVVGKKEGEGPLRSMFDKVVEDELFGCNTWEEAESKLQENTLANLMKKAHLDNEDIRYLFAGDLMGQLIATTFGVVDSQIPLFGIYGACSTFGEAIGLGAMTIAGGYAQKVVCMASSHFCSAEKQFRFPLEYCTQRPCSATWTVTGCGAVVLSDQKQDTLKNSVRIKGITTGKIVDYGCKDAQNMGACMAPAATATIEQSLIDFCAEPEEYDKIITGDLGYTGQTILIDLLKKRGYDISKQHMDCGIEIFDKDKQNTNSGGSGCGCSASVLCSYILNRMEDGDWKKVLFVPTGALMSPISFNEGKSIPGIAHAVILESGID